MPKELPGFYFDEEKNRYFPIKGPIPGSKRPFSSSSASSSSFSPSRAKKNTNPSKRNQDHLKPKTDRTRRLNSSVLLLDRELHGGLFTSNKYRMNSFKQEYERLQASHPMVWKYQNTSCNGHSALEQVHGIFQTPTGLCIRNLLTTGSMNGFIRLYEVGAAKQYLDYAESMAEPVWPINNKRKVEEDAAVGSIWCLASPLTNYSSSISCIKKISKDSPDSIDNNSFFHHALVTTLGSGVSGGSLSILDLHKPLDSSMSLTDFRHRITKIASFDHTIWTTDCNSHGTQAVIGTNLGAALVNLETQVVSWVYRTKSDIFSQQFDQSGNVVLCGLRNGAIVAVDLRQKQSGSFEHSVRPPRMQSARRTFQVPPDRNINRSRGISQFKEHTSPDDAVRMPSAVCSLVALRSDEQYFLGSSMDGSIKLFDHRLLQRGAVQSYTGNVNSHTHLQLGVNPSESLLMSGGEDCFLRIWSVKSSELIFEENVTNSVCRTICWPRSEYDIYGKQRSGKQPEYCYEPSYDTSHSWAAWLGSREGLFYMHGT